MSFQNKVTKTLQSLSAIQINRLNRFLHSPYFVEQNKITELFLLFEPYLKRKADISFSKEEIWHSIFKNNPFNDVKFRRINSDLLASILHFMGIEELEHNQWQQWNNQFESIQKQGLWHLYPALQKQMSRQHSYNDLRDATYYKNEYLIEWSNHVFKRKDFKRSADINFQAFMGAFDHYYLSEKLNYYAELISYKNILSISYTPLFMDEIMDHITHNDYRDIPGVYAYYIVIKMLTEADNEQYYLELKKYLEQYGIAFTKDEARTLFKHAQNYCIRKINAGETSYINQVLDLYIAMIEQELILELGFISPWTYKNIVTTGLRAKQYKWTNSFIEQFKNDLPLDFQENGYVFNKAKYYFEEREYDKVLELLLAVEYQDVFYLLDAKSLLLKTYYELEEFEALEALYHSFKTLLKRKKIVAEYYRNIYQNLISHIFLLAKYRESQNQKKLTDTAEQIMSLKNAADLSWLRDKASFFVSQ